MTKCLSSQLGVSRGNIPCLAVSLQHTERTPKISAYSGVDAFYTQFAKFSTDRLRMQMIAQSSKWQLFLMQVR